MKDKTLCIAIPNVIPQLEISSCEDDIMELLYHKFKPYAYFGQARKNAKRIKFCRDSKFELIVYEDGGTPKKVKNAEFYVETRLLDEAVMCNGFVMLHGAAVAANQQAIIMLAPTETGKSTVTAYLCENGFEYITDDRILVDTNTKEIWPFPKTIMLREGGAKLLQNKYQIDLKRGSFKVPGNERLFWEPINVCKTPVLIKRICVLSREKKPLSAMGISYENRLDYFLRNSMTMRNYDNITSLGRICMIPMELIKYSDLREMKGYLEEILQ